MKASLPLIGILLAACAHAQDAPLPKLEQRYGFSLSESYPQKTPQETMKAIVRAFDSDRVDYLLAHLVDPAFVDGKVAEYKKGFPATLDERTRTLLAFDKLLREVKAHFREDPILEKEIRTFARKAEWKEDGETRVGTLEKTSRKIVMKKSGERWFMFEQQK